MASPPARPVTLCRPLNAAALALALAGSAWALGRSTPSGLGQGNDSIAFTSVARDLLAGRPLYSLHHPPLYAALLAALARCSHADVVAAAFPIALLALAALLVGVWLALHQAVPETLAPAAGVLLVALATPVVEFAGDLGTDLAGASLAVWTWYLLARARAARRPAGWLAATFAVAGIAVLNRFAAMGPVLGVMAVLALRPGASRLRRFAEAAAAGAAMFAPCAAFFIWNLRTYGRAGDRPWHPNPFPWDRVREGFATVAGWVLPTPLATPLAGILIVALAAAAVLGFLRRREPTLPARALLAVLSTYVIVNAAFLILTLCFLDFDLSLDARVLLPVLPAAVMLAAVLCAAGARPVRRASAVAAAAVALLSWHRSRGLIASYAAAGRGYRNLASLQSGLPEYLAAHPDAPLYSDNAPFLYALTGRWATRTPDRYDLMTHAATPDLAGVKARMIAKIAADPRALLIACAFKEGPARMSAEELVRPDRATVEFTCSAGTVLRPVNNR